ncbi:MAG: copper chaperone PCu(A)C [Burkholderiaceae bacterium]|nr:MAG: copper chaperone PCu(A)C [Burkholderiaceae bacterium]
MTYRHHLPPIKKVFSRAFFTCLLLVGVLAGTTMARAAAQGVQVSVPWMRFIMPSRPAAGYFTLSNRTARNRILVGAASPACGMLMLHQSISENGADSMTMVKGVDVPAHGEVVFAPGGYHLMCVSPSSGMIPGHSVPVTLRFKSGDELTTNFPVRGVAGK